MPYLVRLLLTIPVVWYSLSAGEQVDPRQSDVLARCAASTTAVENEGQGEELLGLGFGKFIFIGRGQIHDGPQ